MKTFGEFKEKNAIEEKLAPELREILAIIEKASKLADQMNMKKTMGLLEDARQQIIVLEGK